MSDGYATTVNERAGASLEQRRGLRTFLRHFAEMLIVMFVGMGVLEGLAALAFSAAGGSLSDQSVPFRVMLMGVNMAIPMYFWMQYRGHTLARNVEMAASMILPSVAVAAFATAGTLAAGAAMEIQHMIMIPAMLAVMVWRYDEYSRH